MKRKKILEIQIPLSYKRISSPLKAYTSYKKKYPFTRIKFDKFMSIYAALAGTRAGPIRIARALHTTGETVSKVDYEFRIRNKTLREQIRREELARKKRLEVVVSPEYVADVLRMLRNKGKNALSYDEMAAKLKKKYGHTDRHSIPQINEAHGMIRSAEDIERIGREVTVRSTRKFNIRRFEQLLFAEEVAVFPNGERVTRLRFSLPEIAEDLGIAHQNVFMRWGAGYTDRRSEEANTEVATRKSVGKSTQKRITPTARVAMRDLRRGVVNDELIIKAMAEFERKEDITMPSGPSKGKRRSRRHYFDLLRGAKKQIANEKNMPTVTPTSNIKLKSKAKPKPKRKPKLTALEALRQKYSPGFVEYVSIHIGKPSSMIVESLSDQYPDLTTTQVDSLKERLERILFRIKRRKVV